MLQNDPLRLPPFHFDADRILLLHFVADPDSAFHFDADSDPDPTSQMMRIHAFRNEKSKKHKIFDSLLNSSNKEYSDGTYWLDLTVWLK